MSLVCAWLIACLLLLLSTHSLTLSALSDRPAVQIDRIPKYTTVADLRLVLAERDLDSCRAFYASLRYPPTDAEIGEAAFLRDSVLPDAAVLVESGLVINSSGMRVLYMHVWRCLPCTI